MFNLENAISEWRKQMSAGGVKTPAPLDELESHLREDVEQQMRLGLTGQQAFESAVQRIGHVTALRSEFAKVNEVSREKRKFISLFFVASALPYSWAGTFALLHIEMPLNERILGFGAVIITALLICSWPFLWKFLPGICNRRARKAVQFVCNLFALVWLPSYFYLILPHFDFNLGRLVVAILWAIVPAAALASISSALDETANKKVLSFQ